MASKTVSPAHSNEANEAILKSGFLFKQGGGYRNWKKRYFILRDSSLCYYISDKEDTPKGTINLCIGRGVRSKQQCKSVEQWPKNAKSALTFGVSVENRTYYLYGNDPDTIKDWKQLIQQRIEKIGNPTNAYDKDPEGKPEKMASKLVKQGSKLATKVSKLVIKNSGLDDDTANALEGVTDAAENQAEAGRDASLTDRVKMATGDTAGIVGDNVDNPYVSTAAAVVQEQAEADEDASLQQRLLMGTGTALEGVAEIVGEENEIAGAAVGAVGGVVHDQGEADDEMSVKQRLVLAGGSALSEGGDAVGDVTGLEVVAEILEVAGGVVKDQAEADEDTSLKDRAALAVGSTANGVAGLDSMHFNHEGKAVCQAVDRMAEQVQEGSDGDRE